MAAQPPTSTLFPFTTLFRSVFSHKPSLDLVPQRGAGPPKTPANPVRAIGPITARSEEHTSELQSQSNLVCRLPPEKKKHNKRDLSQAGNIYHSPVFAGARGD